MDTTTDLNYIRKNPASYTWGFVIKIHDIGRYSIVESEMNGRIEFHPYVDGNDFNHYFYSLEKALISAIAFGSIESFNYAHHMAEDACKILHLE